MPSSCTVAALPYDFTDKVILTDEVFTVRFVAARLFPFKIYRAPIVRTPGDVRDVAAAPQTPQLGGAQANFGGPS